MSMIIQVARDDLYTGLASIQNVTGKKGTIAILSNVLFETGQDVLTLTATDLEVGIKIQIPAEVLSPGSITLPSRKLFEIIRETDVERLRIEISENDWASINTEAGTYRIAGTDSEEYPSFPEFDGEILATVPSKQIKELIDKTIFSIAHEGESQFNLTGGLFEKEVKEDGKSYLRAVSSDGHRLSLMEVEAETDVSKINLEKTTLIPRKGVQEIRKFCENNEFVEIGFDQKQAVLKTDNSTIIIRLMNGDFPDYKNIISSIEKEDPIEIGRIDFISALKRINLFTEDLFNAVHFQFNENALVLSSQSMDIGSAQEKVEIQYKGEEMKLGFNGKYFVETMMVLKGEFIKIYLNSEKSPCLIESDEDPGFMSVIMPMKI